MTPEEISALSPGALVLAEGIFYLVYEVRLDPKTGRSLPLVEIVADPWALSDFHSSGRRFPMDPGVARRVA